MREPRTRPQPRTPPLPTPTPVRRPTFDVSPPLPAATSLHRTAAIHANLRQKDRESGGESKTGEAAVDALKAAAGALAGGSTTAATNHVASTRLV